MGIEPTILAWKAKVIPFYDTRIVLIVYYNLQLLSTVFNVLKRQDKYSDKDEKC